MMEKVQVYKNRTIYGRIKDHGERLIKELLIQKDGIAKGLDLKNTSIPKYLLNKEKDDLLKELAKFHEMMESRLNRKTISIIGYNGWHEAFKEFDYNIPPEDEEEWTYYTKAKSFDRTRFASLHFVRKALGSDAQGSREEVEKLVRNMKYKEIINFFAKAGTLRTGFYSVKEVTSDYTLMHDAIRIKTKIPESIIRTLPGILAEDFISGDLFKDSDVKIIGAECQDEEELVLHLDSHSEHNTIQFISDPEN